MKYKRFIKNIFRKDTIKHTNELNGKIIELNMLSKDKLEVKKYEYMYLSKYYKSKANQYKNFSIIITILLSLITILSPFMLQFYTSSVNIADNALKYKIEIISQKDISPEEKVEEMNESVKMIYAEDNNIIDITSKVFSNIINYIFGMIFLCLLITLVFSYLYGRNHDKSERYNILVNYISNKKIK